jgi:phage tail-like protein
MDSSQQRCDLVPNEEYPFTAFNFQVLLTIPNAGGLGLTDPLCDAEFAECDGLEMTMEPKTLQEGGNNTQQIHLVGPVTYGNLTLKRGMTSKLDLWNWFSLASRGETLGLKASGVIIMRNSSRADMVRFKLSDCLPIKIKAPALNAKDGSLAIEEMQLAYGSFSVELV